MQLYNKLSAEERSKLIDKAGEKRLTISFYKYYNIGNPKIFRDTLFVAWNKLNVLGRTYVSKEGINAQISISAKNINQFKKHLDSISFLKNVRLNMAIEQYDKSFLKLKIKVRNKIVSDGINDKDFDPTNIGKHLKAKDFNSIIEKKDTILVDMRNHYESEIGHFKGALTPDVDTFRDSLDVIEENLKEHKQNKNIVMYCTGGIRCEKASAYFKYKGFNKVFQLEGGIIEYVRQTREKNIENKFIGKNFVFDQRRSERISNHIISVCHQCGEACDNHTNCKNQGCHLLFIQCEECKSKMDNCCSNECKQISKLPKETQKKLRKRKYSSNKVFKKGRSKTLKFKL